MGCRRSAGLLGVARLDRSPHQLPRLPSRRPAPLPFALVPWLRYLRIVTWCTRLTQQWAILTWVHQYPQTPGHNPAAGVPLKKGAHILTQAKWLRFFLRCSSVATVRISFGRIVWLFAGFLVCLILKVPILSKRLPWPGGRGWGLYRAGPGPASPSEHL